MKQWRGHGYKYSSQIGTESPEDEAVEEEGAEAAFFDVFGGDSEGVGQEGAGVEKG